MEVRPSALAPAFSRSATIWRLPDWAYTHPPDAENMNNRIAEEKWPEVLNCISTYLQYAKEKYGAEPDYFSFNEPNIGVHLAALVQRPNPAGRSKL